MKNFLFELKEGLIISFKAIKGNKIRSVLTTLGIIIGVWAVVVMTMAIRGIDESFQTMFPGISTHIIHAPGIRLQHRHL